MDEQYTGKCREIFEKGQEVQDIKAELEQFQEYFDYEASEEYRFILERYAGSYIRVDYGIKSLERTPLTDQDGFDFVCCFFPVKGKHNVFSKYEVYQQQLPEDFIPIGELDGGNLLCLNRATGGIYTWVHDEPGRNMHLAQHNMHDFILSFEKMECRGNADSGIVEVSFAPSFLEALRNYRK